MTFQEFFIQYQTLLLALGSVLVLTGLVWGLIILVSGVAKRLKDL